MEQSIKEILETAKIIAVIGCSSNRYRTSYHISSYLKQEGYRVIPVNPEYEDVLGEKCYNSVVDIPQDIRIDVVNIFRNSEFTADMVDTIIERVKLTGHKPVVWTQLGVSSAEAKKKAETAGLIYVEEHCMMVDHRRLLG